MFVASRNGIVATVDDGRNEKKNIRVCIIGVRGSTGPRNPSKKLVHAKARPTRDRFS
jgi:hypothetical protein